MGSKNKEKCEVCGKDTQITLAYGPHYFCEKHFCIFFEDRVKRTIRKYNLIKSKEKLLIALSGGKDSTVVLFLMKKLYSKSNEIKALIIDEGVNGYREKAIVSATNNCKKLGVEYKVIEFKKEFGITNDELMPLIMKNEKLGGTCSFCGTLRRNIMNKYAKKMKADKLITGHNLDDEVQSFVMNVFNNDFNKMKRMGANAGIIEHTGFVKRIKPLYETCEKEIIAYCAYNGIEHYSEECCPYSWTAKRNEYREMLNHFETRFPGTEYSILRFNENLKKEIKTRGKKQSESLHECKICNEPTEKELCKACEMIERIKKEKESKNKTKGNEKENLINKTKESSKTELKENSKSKKHLEKYNKKLTCATTKGTCE